MAKIEEFVSSILGIPFIDRHVDRNGMKAEREPAKAF